MGSTFYRKLQFGVEGTKGTAVAADTIIAHATIPPVNPDSVTHRPPVNAGVRARSVGGHSYRGQKFWSEPLSFDDGYYQILPLLGSLGIVGGFTGGSAPSEVNVGEGDYLWDFDPSLTGTNALDSITLEMGDDDQAYEVEYVMVNSLSIEGTINQGQEPSIVTFSANLFGRQVTKDSFTGGLSIPDTDLVNAKLARLYKDSTWANLGTTELTSVLRGFNIEIAELAHAKQLGSADKFFTTHGQGMIECRMGLTLERGTASEAIRDDAVADPPTTRALRLEIDSGVQIGAGANHKLTIDMIGTFDPAVAMAEEDRSNLVDTADLVAEYDGTSGKKFRMQVVTDVDLI